MRQSLLNNIRYNNIILVVFLSQDKRKPYNGKAMYQIANKKLLLLLLRCFSRVRLCATPQTAAHQAPPSLGFSRQEYWSALPFPSPRHESESEVARSCLTLSDSMEVATRFLCQWDFPGESTGVGCHFLLQANEKKNYQIHNPHNGQNKFTFGIVRYRAMARIFFFPP